MGVIFRFRTRDNCNLGRVLKLVITNAEKVVMQTCPKHCVCYIDRARTKNQLQTTEQAAKQ
jgi:hypothetical protein